MKGRMILVLLQSLLVLGQSRNLQSTPPYCDQWTTNCSGRYRCVNNQCVLRWGCVGDLDCSSGYTCVDTQCIPNTQPPFTGPYCDLYSPCSSDKQCLQHKCIAVRCSGNYDCPIGFYCNGKSICGSDKQYGSIQGYCDQWTKCPMNYSCVDKQCVPSSCYSNANCAYPYTCQQFQCKKV